jgi:hypothetical protein
VASYRGIDTKRALLAAVALATIPCIVAEPTSAQDKVLSETLSAGERADFVKQVAAGCLENQRTASENKGVPEAAINAYCRCTAEQMVTRFSAAEIERIVENITPELQVRVDRLEQACVPKAK